MASAILISQEDVEEEDDGLKILRLVVPNISDEHLSLMSRL